MSMARKQSDQVWDKTNGRCWYCGQHLIKPKHDKNKISQYRWFAIDHLEPLCLGGSDDLENLVPACWICNCSKHSKTLEEYRAYAGRIRAGIPKFRDDQLAWLASMGFSFPILEPHVFWGEQFEDVDR